jgi:phosphoribosylformylglycinamidine synthase
MSKPSTLILRTAGTNCDGETAYAFELAGAGTEMVHINRLLREPEMLDRFQILAIPGGFSYGDDIAAGRILANQIVHHLGDAVRSFVETGRPVIGVCNGFQVLVKTGLLPGPPGTARAGGDSGVGTGLGAGRQSATLANNDSGRFVDRWVRLAARESKCVWTADLEPPVIELPVAHGEGKFVPRDEPVRRALWENGQVALVYAKEDGSPAQGNAPDNPNGSVDDIAGVCDASGLVFGLMPHPERYVDAIQHPAWTSRRDKGRAGQGLQIFANAVRHVRDAVGAGV